MELFKSFKFEAAHSLPHVPEGHKCKKLHGHSYKIRIYVTGKVDAYRGWVMDFEEITVAMAPLIKMFDHSCLNEIKGLENPTSENLAIWIWNRIIPSLPGLSQVHVYETSTTGCIYNGE